MCCRLPAYCFSGCNKIAEAEAAVSTAQLMVLVVDNISLLPSIGWYTVLSTNASVTPQGAGFWYACCSWCTLCGFLSYSPPSSILQHVSLPL
jgi:hypothetical protein